jgi:hypothetical protein
MTWAPLLQILHHPPHNPVPTIPLKPHMIAIDPENTRPTRFHACVLQSELHVGERLVDFFEEIAANATFDGVPAACVGWLDG